MTITKQSVSDCDASIAVDAGFCEVCATPKNYKLVLHARELRGGFADG